MSADLLDFIDEVHRQPRVAAAMQRDAALAAHFEVVAFAMRRVEELSCDDPKWLGLLDELRAIVVRHDVPPEERLLAIGRVFERIALKVAGARSQQ